MPTPTDPAAGPLGPRIDALMARLRTGAALARADRRCDLPEYLLREEAAGRGQRIQACAAGDCTEAADLAQGADGLPAANAHEPLRRVRVTFSDPPRLAETAAVLARSPCAPPRPPTR